MDDKVSQKGNIIIIDNSLIQEKIYTIRGVQVMLDSDIAKLFKAETRRLNEQVKRNAERFPEEFMFQLSEHDLKLLRSKNDVFDEPQNLRSQNATSRSTHGGRRYLPYAFTEQGVAMLSAVIRSETAVKMSIQIMKAFVNMRHFLIENAQIFSRIERIEQKQIEVDSKLEQIFNAISSKEIKPKQGIFFEGQIFDAYKLLVDIVKSAQSTIYIIDNYIDETILTVLTKRKPKVDVKIFTKNVTKQMQLDVIKYNKQYPQIELLQLNKAHDRFIVIDEKDVYHLGASLKDLGKKWFAFTKMNKDSISLIKQLKRIVS
jgi:phage regulator Rha-like protein